MTYAKLKAGDVRRTKDEVRRTIPYGKLGYDGCGDDRDFSHWQPVRLIGHTILASDLMVCEFRREIAID